MNTTGNLSSDGRDMTDVSLHEIFEEVGKETKISEKVKILQSWDSPAVRAVLRGAYDPTIKWLVPNTKPPFTVNDVEDWGLAPLRLDVEVLNQISKYVSRQNSDGVWDTGIELQQTRREQFFIEFIEGLHSTEVEIVFGMVKRKLPYKGVTPKLANQAFPGLIPDGTPI